MPNLKKSFPWLVLAHVLVAFFFVLSGFAALLYQVAWQRALFAIFGINVEAVTVVVTADRGLSGAFSTNIIKAAQARIDEQYAALLRSGKLHLVTVGRKGSDFFAKRRYPVARTYNGIFGKLAFTTAQQIARPLVESFASGATDRIELIYNEFKNVAQQRIVVEPFLPVPGEAVAEGTRRYGVDYIYEPDAATILAALLPRYLEFQIWRALLESAAAEHGARMTAMDSATNNASEMIDRLTLHMNKVRQAAITKEIIEVVSGAGRPA